MQGASVNGCAFCYDRNRDIFTFRIRGIQRGATQSNIHYLFLTCLTFPKGVSPDSSRVTRIASRHSGRRTSPASRRSRLKSDIGVHYCISRFTMQEQILQLSSTIKPRGATSPLPATPSRNRTNAKIKLYAKTARYRNRIYTLLGGPPLSFLCVHVLRLDELTVFRQRPLHHILRYQQPFVFGYHHRTHRPVKRISHITTPRRWTKNNADCRIFVLPLDFMIYCR